MSGLHTPVDRFNKSVPAGRALVQRVASTPIRPRAYSLPRITCPPAPGAESPLKVGVFGAIHGDEPSGVSACLELASWARRYPAALDNFELHLYPECNPTGLAARTRHSRSGLDLNREFWSGSDQPEVRWLEDRLRTEQYTIIVALHEDDTSDGVYGFVNGSPLSEHLLCAGLTAAARLVPRNTREHIDAFAAERGIIRGAYPGILSAPPEQRPRPFEIVLETPGHASLSVRTEAAVVAVQTILAEYGKLFASGVIH